MKEYIPVILIASIAVVGFFCIIMDFIFSYLYSEEVSVKIVNRKPNQNQESKTKEESEIEDILKNYDDDLIINE